MLPVSPLLALRASRNSLITSAAFLEDLYISLFTGMPYSKLPVCKSSLDMVNGNGVEL